MLGKERCGVELSPTSISSHTDELEKQLGRTNLARIF